ncbi:hypothetical protein P7C70_g5992, partial [Phenoliferia sp. Uapishka_3]
MERGTSDMESISSFANNQRVQGKALPSDVTRMSASAHLPSSTLPRRRSSYQSHGSKSSIHLEINRSNNSAPQSSLPAYNLVPRVYVLPRRPLKVLLAISTAVFLVAAARYSQTQGIHSVSHLSDSKTLAAIQQMFTLKSKHVATPPSTSGSCETCVLNPQDPLCKYGIRNIRLSRMYEGSGYRVQKVIEKALRGEKISVSIIGASVTAGQGLVEGQKKWQDVFLEDWMNVFPNTSVHTGAWPGKDSEFFSYCFDNLVPTTSDIYFVELDINNRFEDAVYRHDDDLYRGLLQLAQKPAVVRVSVFAMLFENLQGGTPSALTMSNYFDIPMIGTETSTGGHEVKIAGIGSQ